MAVTPLASVGATNDCSGASFFFVTALSLSCFVPTLFGGSVNAAYAPPPSAMNTAIVAITFA